MFSRTTLTKPWTPVLFMAALASACADSDDGPIDAASSGTGASGTGGSATGGTKAGTGGAKTGGTGGSTGGTDGTGGSGGSTGGTDGTGGSADAGTSGSAQGGSGGDGGAAGEVPGTGVPLGAAEDFAILTKSGISTVPTSAITGNLGVSPVAESYVTGFSLTADSTNRFSTSVQVTGKIYAADHSSPTPSNLTTAVGDMELAFTDAAGRAPDVTELGAGDVGGMTLEPGVYQWGTGLLIPTDLTLAGSQTSTWIFQIAQNLTVNSGTKIVLSGGASAKNVFWQVAGQVSLGTTAHFEGIVLCQTAISLGTGASINGRLLAQTAVTLDGNTVIEPAP
jgi:hypothetical protein